jgi:tetratricopeptide (TPR) repeat protein
MSILGPQADKDKNFRSALDKASQEIYSNLDTVNLFFAWYDRGTNLVDLQDYNGAAQAYDQAFAIYNTLPEDKKVRPYRILWYETGPYFAYYYMSRYQNVIDLATQTMQTLYFDDTGLEESLYWRGMARLAMGDRNGAIDDFNASLKWHPAFAPAVTQLQNLGVGQ